MKYNTGNPSPSIGLVIHGSAKGRSTQTSHIPLSEIAERYNREFDRMRSEGSFDLKALVSVLPDLTLKKGQHWDFIVNEFTPSYLLTAGWAWMLSGALDEHSAWQVLLWVTSLGSLTGEWSAYHLITGERCLTELRMRSASSCLDDSVMRKAAEGFNRIGTVMIDKTVRISLLAWVDGAGLQRVTFRIRKTRKGFVTEIFGMVAA